jgi:hypothetical protein
MGSPRTKPERDYDNELWTRIGLIGGVALAGLLFPALPIGLFVGGSVGLAWPRGRRNVPDALREQRGLGWSLLAAGGVVALICAALAVAGPLAGEIERFLSSWHPSGAKLINPKAFLRFPWGWLPVASAIGLATAGVTIVLRNRR